MAKNIATRKSVINDIRFVPKVTTATAGSVQVDGRFISVEEDLCVLGNITNDYFPGFTIMDSVYLPFVSEMAKREGFVSWPDNEEDRVYNLDYYEDSTNLLDLFDHRGVFLGGKNIIRNFQSIEWNTPSLLYIRSLIGYKVKRIVMPPRILEIRPLPHPNVRTILDYFDALEPFNREIRAMAEVMNGKIPRLLFIWLVNKRVIHQAKSFDEFMHWYEIQMQFNVRKSHEDAHHYSDKHMVNVFTFEIANTSNQYIRKGMPHQLTACLGMKGIVWHYLVDVKVLHYRDHSNGPEDYWGHASWFYTAILLRTFTNIVRSKNRKAFREIPMLSKAAWNCLAMTNDPKLHALLGMIFSKYIPPELLHNFVNSCGFDDLNNWLDQNLNLLRVYSDWSRLLAFRCSVGVDHPYPMKTVNFFAGII